MKRKIYLEGELGDKFGKELSADVSSVKEALKLIDANFPGFKQYLVDSHDKGVGFLIDIEDKSIETEEDFILPLNEIRAKPVKTMEVNQPMKNSLNCFCLTNKNINRIG